MRSRLSERARADSKSWQRLAPVSQRLECEAEGWIMGLSFVDFRGHGFWVRDPLLEIWMRIMCLQLEDADSPGWQHDLREWWLLQSRGCFTGCISPDLDAYLTDAERVQAFLSVADRSIERLRMFGTEVPAAFLNTLSVEGGYGMNLPLDYFEQIAHHLRKLVSGNLEADAGSGPVLPLGATLSIGRP